MKSIAMHDIVATPDAPPTLTPPDPAASVAPSTPVFLAELYQTALGRAPDAAGVAFYAAQLQSGTSLTDVAAQFVNSTEFAANNGTLSDAQFVGLLYQNLLHRAADFDGLTYWMSTAASEPRGQALVDFISTANQHPADLPPLIGQQPAATDLFQA